MRKTTRTLAGAAMVAAVASSSLAAQVVKPSPDLLKLQQQTARFASATIGADVSHLPPGEKACLAKLVEAARIMDTLFLRQVWAGNETLLLSLLGDKTPAGAARLRYFLINKGPWSRLDGNEPFMPGVGAKPEEANFYPAGATKPEVDAWMKGLPDDASKDARGFFTTIRRGAGGALAPVPFSM